MSDTSLNSSPVNFNLEPIVVMKDFMKESATPNLSEGAFKMSCALCKTRGDPATFFGRFCTVECSKTDKMFKSCSQYRKSSNGAIVEAVNSPVKRFKRQCNGSTRQPRKSSPISNDTPSVARPILPSKTRESRPSYNSCTQKPTDPFKNQPDQNSWTNEMQESKHFCIICGKVTSNRLCCSGECVASNARQMKLTDSSNKVINTSDEESTAQDRGPSPRKRKRQADRIASIDENVDKRGTTSITDAFYPNRFRKCKQLPALGRLRERMARNYFTQESHDDYGKWTLEKASDKLLNTRKTAINDVEKESATPEIQVGNIRSVHQQNDDLLQSQRSPEQKKVNGPSLDDPEFLGNPEQVHLEAQPQNSACNHNDDHGYRCHNDVTDGSTQSATRENFMQNGLDCFDKSMEPESRPTCRNTHRDANCPRRSPTTEDDLKRGFFFPQNPEIQRLHCEEIKSRIAVNQAKLMFFESELEKSRLEQKLLISKLNCD